uniref:Prolactin releasing hormone n=1 Tax=Dicentrarchus labrax TaxID=13489 RepID=A0A8C4H2C0_DICLA
MKHPGTSSSTDSGFYVCFFAPGRTAMRVCAVLCVLLLLLNEGLSGSHRDGSIIIRNPDIDASWYTGRGIRPLGRFGRKVARRNKHLAFITAKVYRPTADMKIRVLIFHCSHCLCVGFY